MKDNQVHDDTEAWEPLTGWLAGTHVPQRLTSIEVKPEPEPVAGMV
jgi:hypothetical protein